MMDGLVAYQNSFLEAQTYLRQGANPCILTIPNPRNTLAQLLPLVR